MEPGLSELGIKNEKILKNLSNGVLIESCVRDYGGHLSDQGSLVVETGKHTGRAAQDKYAVETSETKESIWWGADVKKMSLEKFEKIKELIITHLNKAPRLFVAERSVGACEKNYLGLRLLTESPSHNLFANHLFRDPKRGYLATDDYTILHAPSLKVDAKEFDLRSSTVITTHFESKTILIVGTFYHGEIKKSIFSVMNYILPQKNILPMHAGANIGSTNTKGEVSIFLWFIRNRKDYPFY